jgi:hypothetical protein
MIKLVTGIVIVSVALFSLALQAQAVDPLPPIPPMPESFKNIRLVKPAPSVPKEITDLLGVWEGVWVVRLRPGDLPREVRRAQLIIYEVTPAKVKYLWGVGANPETHAEAKWEKYESDFTVRGGKTRFFHQGSYGYNMETRKTEFYLEDGVLMGTIGAASIEMKKKLYRL